MRRVLVVDHNADAADTLALLLSLDAYEVRVAYDGAAAIEMFQQSPADIAVIDVDVPPMNGYCVARWLKASQPSVHLVAISSVPLDSHLEAHRSGFSCALAKPFPGRALREVLLAAEASRCGADAAPMQ